MKLAQEIIRLLSDTIKEIPKKYVFIWLAIYYGLWFLVSIIFIVDWLIHNGQRNELLLLLDKL